MSAEGRAAGAVGWDIYTCMRVDCFWAPLLFTLAQGTQIKYTESFSSLADVEGVHSVWQSFPWVWTSDTIYGFRQGDYMIMTECSWRSCECPGQLSNPSSTNNRLP